MRKLFYFFPAIFFAVLMTGCAVREYFWTPVEPGTAFIRESRTTEPAIADSSVAEVPKDERAYLQVSIFPQILQIADRSDS